MSRCSSDTHRPRKEPAMATKKKSHSGTPASPEQLRARLELRRSSAASKHIPAHRKGTRGAQRSRAIAAAW